MARARNIKPGFYQNDQLAECSVWARFIFPGLWMLADRDGKMEDRPARIKAALLPYDSQNADKLLAELHNHGFITRYSVSGCKYIAINNFHKHQNPHVKEPESTIPDPDGDGPPDVPEPDQSGARTGPDAGQNSSGPADSGFRIPSPDSLIPESLSTERFRDVWARWRQHRQEIKAPLKPSQEAGQLKKLAAEGEAAACARVERSIVNGWRGLWFPDDDRPKAKHGGHPPPRNRDADLLAEITDAQNRESP